MACLPDPARPVTPATTSLGFLTLGTAVLILAAGAGIRAGGERPKQYQAVGGKPVLRLTAESFLSHPGVSDVLIVIGEGHEALYAEALHGLSVLPPVMGGLTRQQSALNGLRALAARQPRKVLIHDAARPFASHAIISQVIAALEQHEGVIPALPVTDTLKRAPGGIITSTVSRESLWGAQTPQGFRFPDILQAHEKAAAEGLANLTDDAAVAEHAGLSVGIVAGEAANRKLTTLDDIADAERAILRAAYDRLPDVRVGQGYDVHAFEPGNHVVLCGVKVPHNLRLKGHSDADVAMHALTDAILGAISEGDIGQHFPPSDPQWKGADSAIFLRHANNLVKGRGGLIAHTDITIICEEPKIGPHVPAMRAALSEILAVPGQRVAIKATTSEKLGFTGRREGIAAYATATVRLPL